MDGVREAFSIGGGVIGLGAPDVGMARGVEVDGDENGVAVTVGDGGPTGEGDKLVATTGEGDGDAASL